MSQNKTDETSHFRGLRQFGLFLVLLALFTGFALLVTNGLYIWKSQPGQAVLAEVRTLLQAGIPVEARTETERLDFYHQCETVMSDWPERMARLDASPWAIAVLLKEEAGHAGFQDALDVIERGKTAVREYMKNIRSLSTEIKSYSQAGDDPSILPEDVPSRLEWFRNRVAGANRLEDLYHDLQNIPDLDLAGHLFSESELGLDTAIAGLSDYEPEIEELQMLLDDNQQLELELDEIYNLDPDLEQWDRIQLRLDELLEQQKQLDIRSLSLADRLPQSLSEVFHAYQAGMSLRMSFITSVRGWWEFAMKAESSMLSAKTDRETAKRYIEDSLEEGNTETAYLWTRTAETYRISMITAIDFTNIYIGRMNGQITQIAESREAYRSALGLPGQARKIPESPTIDADEFWLVG